MRYKPFFSLVLFLSMMALGQGAVFASCRGVLPLTGAFYFYFGDHWRISPPENEQIGLPITEWVASPYQLVFKDCTYKNGQLRIGMQVGNSTAGHPTGGTYDGHTIFPTGIQGVGFIMAVKSNLGNSPNAPAQWTPVVAPPGFVPTNDGFNLDLFTATGGPLPGTSFYAAVRMRMIQTHGTQIGDRSWVDSSSGGYGGFYPGNHTNLTLPTVKFTWRARFKRDKGGCTVSIPTPIVPLGTYGLDEFIHPGSRSTRKCFNISLTNCTPVSDAGNKVSFIVSGVPDPAATGMPGTLRIGDPNDPLNARGVGIELAYKDYSGQLFPVRFDEKVEYKKFGPGQTGGNLDIEFFANYIKNYDSVRRPGEANASITILVTFEGI